VAAQLFEAGGTGLSLKNKHFFAIRRGSNPQITAAVSVFGGTPPKKALAMLLCANRVFPADLLANNPGRPGITLASHFVFVMNSTSCHN